VPAPPSWPTNPPWDQAAAPPPPRPSFDPTHPPGYHRRRIADRIACDKPPRFARSPQGITHSTRAATTIRARRDQWIRLGVFAPPKRIAPPHA
jgi:hypothetical protein